MAVNTRRNPDLAKTADKLADELADKPYGKKEEFHVTSLRVPKDQYAKFKAKAKAKGHTIGGLIKVWIDNYLDE